MSKPQNNKEGIKRESILKYILMQNTNGNQQDIYSNGFVNEKFDSESEDEMFEF